MADDYPYQAMSGCLFLQHLTQVDGPPEDIATEEKLAVEEAVGRRSQQLHCCTQPFRESTGYSSTSYEVPNISDNLLSEY